MPEHFRGYAIDLRTGFGIAKTNSREGLPQRDVLVTRRKRAPASATDIERSGQDGPRTAVIGDCDIVYTNVSVVLKVTGSGRGMDEASDYRLGGDGSAVLARADECGSLNSLDELERCVVKCVFQLGTFFPGRSERPGY